jgi:hypothetical protein
MVALGINPRQFRGHHTYLDALRLAQAFGDEEPDPILPRDCLATPRSQENALTAHNGEAPPSDFVEPLAKGLQPIADTLKKMSVADDCRAV